MLWLSPHHAQQLIDRVVARVDGAPVTLTDVQAALGSRPHPGAAGRGSGRRRHAADDRSPARAGRGAAISAARARSRGCHARDRPPEDECRRAAAGLDAVDRSHDQRINDIARDNLRIAGYLDQRFGNAVQVSDEEVAAYYRTHEAEFTRGGRRCAVRGRRAGRAAARLGRAPPCDRRSVDTRPPLSRRCLDQSATNHQPITTNQLRHQHRRSRRLSRLQILVRLHGILRRIPLVDVDLHLAGLDDVEEIVGQATRSSRAALYGCSDGRVT